MLDTSIFTSYNLVFKSPSHQTHWTLSQSHYFKEYIHRLFSAQTLKHSSVAKYLAIEQSETFSGQFSSNDFAAVRTIFLETTSFVAMSASRNDKYWKKQQSIFLSFFINTHTKT